MTVHRYIPNDLLLEVLPFLDPIDLANAHATCRQWRVAANDDELWRALFPGVASPVKRTIDRQAVRSERAFFERVQGFARSMRLHQEAALQFSVGSSRTSILFTSIVTSDEQRLQARPADPVVLRLLQTQMPIPAAVGHDDDLDDLAFARVTVNNTTGPGYRHFFLRRVEGPEALPTEQQVARAITSILQRRHHELIAQLQGHRLLPENRTVSIHWPLLIGTAATIVLAIAIRHLFNAYN